MQRILLSLAALSSITAGCASKGLGTKPNTPAVWAVEEFYFDSEPKAGKTKSDYTRALTRTHQFIVDSPISKDNIQIELITEGSIKLQKYELYEEEQRKLGKSKEDINAGVAKLQKNEIAEFTQGKTCFYVNYIAISYRGITDGGNANYWGVKVLNEGKEVPAKLSFSEYGIVAEKTYVDSNNLPQKSTEWTQFNGRLCTAKSLNLKGGIAIELHPRFLKSIPIKRFEWLVKAPAPVKK